MVVIYSPSPSIFIAPMDMQLGNVQLDKIYSLYLIECIGKNDKMAKYLQRVLSIWAEQKDQKVIKTEFSAGCFSQAG